MAARSKARKRALDVLYAAEARSVDPLEVLAERLADAGTGAGGTGTDAGTDAGTAPLGDYATGLIRGVAEHRVRIDELIAQHSIDWTLARMPAVDRAILRIAVYEMVYGGLDSPVAVNEAVELAKLLSTDASPRFVNGVLGQIAVIVPNLRGSE